MLDCVSMELALNIDSVDQVADIISQYSSGTTKIYYTFIQGKNGRKSLYNTKVNVGTDDYFVSEDYTLLKSCISSIDLGFIYEDDFNAFIKALQDKQVDFEVHEFKKPKQEVEFTTRLRNFN